MSVSLMAFALTLAIPRPTSGIVEHSEVCEGKTGWNDPAPPLSIWANIYDVGTCGIVSLLIVGPRGHVLIDGATADAAPGIIANIRKLGLEPRDVKLILASHEHVDHVGGLPELQRRTGAEVRLSPTATRVLATGDLDPADPQRGAIAQSPALRAGRPLRDGETISVGPIAVTAHFTPGHAPGGTSWTWNKCIERRCLRIVYADSLTAVSADGYRFRDHPERVAALRSSIATIAALPCDLLITPHPGASDLYDRRYGPGRLVDRQACQAYANRARQGLEARLAKENAR